MSTRAQLAVYESEDVKIEDAELYIYRHSDGYPGTPDGKEYGVLSDIVPFLKKFNEARGIDDTSYCTARLVQHLGNVFDKDVSGDDGREFYYLGLGLDKGGSSGIHDDIEYFYHISPTAVKVFEITEWDSSWSTWKMIKRVALKSKKKLGV